MALSFHCWLLLARARSNGCIEHPSSFYFAICVRKLHCAGKTRQRARGGPIHALIQNFSLCELDFPRPEDKNIRSVDQIIWFGTNSPASWNQKEEVFFFFCSLADLANTKSWQWALAGRSSKHLAYDVSGSGKRSLLLGNRRQRETDV